MVFHAGPASGVSVTPAAVVVARHDIGAVEGVGPQLPLDAATPAQPTRTQPRPPPERAASAVAAPFFSVPSFIMLLFSLIPPALAATVAARRTRSSRVPAAEELDLATRLLERRRELLAIALLDPASDAELDHVAAELDGGTLAVAVVDDPGISPDEARARFEELRARVRALHTSLTRLPPTSSLREETPRGELGSALAAALASSTEIARSLRLEWGIVDRVLQSGWLQKLQNDGSERRGRAEVLPPALAARATAAQHDVESLIERLVTSHQNLVYSVARRYRGLGLSREDLMQDGNIGLLRAIEKFDARRGKPFAAYAVWWVRHAVRNAVADRARTIRLPVSALARRFAVNRASNRLAQELGRDPSQQELSSATGVAPESIADVLRMPKEPISLDAPLSAENGRTLGDGLWDPLARDADEATWERELAAQLHTLFEVLTPRERHVLSLRFGLKGHDEHTLEQIGHTLGLTRERIRQIAAAAMKKLELALEDRELGV